MPESQPLKYDPPKLPIGCHEPTEELADDVFDHLSALAGVPALERAAKHEPRKAARTDALRDWEMNEWLRRCICALWGMPGQPWNAVAFLIACRDLDGVRLFGAARPVN